MDSLLLVQPSNVDFPATSAPAGSVGDYASAWLRLSSASATPVAFKVKTTKPSRYCVRPNHGVVLPNGGVVDVEVICLEPPAPTVGAGGVGAGATPVVVCRDKFLIQATPATGALSAAELASGGAASLSPAFWSSVPPGGLLELKMKVSFAPPPPPGSAAAEPVAPTAAVAAAAAAAAATAAATAATPPPPLMHPPSAGAPPPPRFSTPAAAAPLTPVQSGMMADLPVLPSAIRAEAGLSPAVGAAEAAAPSRPSEAVPRSTAAVDDGEAASAATTAAEEERSRREAQLAATEARVADLEAQLDASVSEREGLSQALISARSAAALAEAEAAEAAAAQAAAEAASAEREAVARVGSVTDGVHAVTDEATALAKEVGGKGGVLAASPGGGELSQRIAAVLDGDAADKAVSLIAG